MSKNYVERPLEIGDLASCQHCQDWLTWNGSYWVAKHGNAFCLRSVRGVHRPMHVAEPQEMRDDDVPE